MLKNEMKVFFVKYNDPIYVKLEKLDIMIRLTNHSNIAQVLAELKESVLSRCVLDLLRKLFALHVLYGCCCGFDFAVLIYVSLNCRLLLPVEQHLSPFSSVLLCTLIVLNSVLLHCVMENGVC